MGLVEYAKRELDRIPKDKDGIQEMINKDIIEIIEALSKQGHSGFSATYAINVLERLMRFKPLSPITEDPEEWNIIREDNGIQTLQARRCSSVFMEKTLSGVMIRCEDIDGIIVSDNGGITWFSSGRFRKEVTLPYLPVIKPERVYIEYTEEVQPGFTSDEYEVITEKPERIDRLYRRKRAEFDSVEVE